MHLPPSAESATLTWTRTKRWIGDHPQRAIAVVLTAWLALFPLVAILSLVRTILPPVHTRVMVLLWHWPSVFTLARMAYLLLTPVVLVGWPCYVGCVLARAGLPVELGWNAPMWVFVGASCIALPCYVVACIYAGDGWLILAAPLLSALAGLAAGIPAGFGTMIGLRQAERITAWMVRRGKWEVTRPVPPGRRDEEDRE